MEKNKYLISENKINIKTHMWYHYVFLYSIFIFIFSIISCIFSRQELYMAIFFSGYQIFAILLPGLLYTILLKQDCNRNGVSILFIAYAIGYISNIILYYLLYIVGGLENTANLYTVIFMVESCVAIVWFQKGRLEFNENNQNYYIALIFTLILFVFELFTYCGYNSPPPSTDGSAMWKDVLYWIGNITSLKLGYPPVEFRDLTSPYTYHFFSSIQLAVESITTNISTLVLGITFSYIQSILLIIGGIYCLVEEYIHNKSEQVFMYILILFTVGFESITRVNWSTHLFYSQYGFDYGLGLMLFFLLLFSKFIEQGHSWYQYISLIMFFVIIMGVKSPFACILLAMVGIVCLYFLFEGKWKSAFLYGLSILSIFILMYVTICNVRYTYGSRDINKPVDLQIHHWNVCGDLNQIREGVFHIFTFSDFFAEAAFFVIFALLCQPFLLYFLVKAFNQLRKNKKITKMEVACIAGILVGLMIALYIHMEGKSNTYFALATYPLMFFIIVRAQKYSKPKRISEKIGNFFILLCGIGLLLFTGPYQPTINYTVRGVKNSFGNFLYIEEPWVSKYEYDVLMFAKEHIDNNEILISVNTRRDDRNFAGIISEHFTYNIYVAESKDILSEVNKYADKYESDYIICPIQYKNIFKNIEMLYENGGGKNGYFVGKYNRTM